MTYFQTFKGSLRFADAHCLEAGLDALTGYRRLDEENAIRVADFEIDGLAVRLDYENSLPASMSFGTCSALRLLAKHALSGTIRATYEGSPTETIRAGGRRDARDLPPRHRRWEVFDAARAGSAKALRALRAQGVDIVVELPSWFGIDEEESSLRLAAAAGSPAAVRVLIEAGAKPDAKALAVAKNRAVAEVLLAAGVKPKGLEVVCEDGHADVALALIEAGAKMPAKKSTIVKMLRDIVRTGRLDLLQAVARHEPIRRALANPEPIELAIELRKPRIVAFLIRHGAKRPVEPPDPVPVLNRAARAWEDGKYEESLALARSVDDERYTLEINGFQGLSLGFLGRYAQAIAALRKGLDAEPDDAMWCNCLAYFLACAGRARDAKTYYEKALSLVETELADAPSASLWSRKAYSLNGLGRFAEALEAASRGLAIEPNHTLALVNAGRALLETKKPKEARAKLERAVKSSPKLPEPKFYLAVARARCGDAKGAHRALAKVIAVSPHFARLAKKDASLAARQF